VDRCWTENPALEPVVPGTPLVMTGPAATHRIACHNPALPEDAEHGRPTRAGHVAAPAPEGEIDELASLAAIADGVA
jgi:hypothetical protein